VDEANLEVAKWLLNGILQRGMVFARSVFENPVGQPKVLLEG